MKKIKKLANRKLPDNKTLFSGLTKLDSGNRVRIPSSRRPKIIAVAAKFDLGTRSVIFLYYIN